MVWVNWGYVVGRLNNEKSICDAVQQNMEQVIPAFFEKAIEVGIEVKNDSSVDFQIFCSITYLKMSSIISM